MTFSITGWCEKTGQLGIAISTKVIAVGARCTFAKAHVGAIASQASSNPYLGIKGLQYLEAGLTAEEVLAKVLSEDSSPEYRTLSIVDSKGRVAAHTGANCVDWFGHQVGDHFVAAGNMLVGKETVEAMAKTFAELADTNLPERLLRALEAGQAAGGDKRGRQSAALLVVDEEDYPYLDLRVDEHEDPVKELRRIWTLAEKELLPRMALMPTKKNPAGINDRASMESIGLINKDQ